MPTMTADHARECAAFLVELRRTANAKLSAERVGVGLQKLHHRRRTYPAFAGEWAAAVAFAEATPWSRMSLDQALMVLGMHHKRVKGGRSRHAHNAKPATAADTDAAITGLLKRLHVRRDAGGELPAWTRDADCKSVLVVKADDEG